MPFETKSLPAAADLWGRYSYNPLTGELFSLKRPNWRGPVGYVKADGYRRLNMKWAGFEASVHRVIWKWFTASDPIGSIDHINRDRDDNRIWNLREAGPTLQSRNHSRCKLNIEKVSGIKAELAKGATLVSLAKKHGVTFQAIHEIKAGRNWKDVQ